MSDTKKKYQNSSPKKTDYSTLIYFLVWLLLSGLIITGGILVFNWWGKRRVIKNVKKAIHNVDKRPSTDELDSRYENTRGRIYQNSHRVKKFATKIKENLKELGIWEEDLKKIKAGLTPYEKLKQVKHDPEQLEEVWLAVYREMISLDILNYRLFTDQEIKQQVEDQKKWLVEQADEEGEEAKKRFKPLINHFYHLFRNTLPEEVRTTPSSIWPVLIQGRPANPNKLKEEINYLITKYGNDPNPTIRVRVLERKWNGFTGYDIDESKSKEGTNIMGLTISIPYLSGNPKEGIKVISNHTENEGIEGKEEHFVIVDGDKFKGFAEEAATEIKLKKELLFSRQNRYYTEWITYDEEEESVKSTLDISEESLLNTIAHELAHAIINSIRYEYEPKNGGHGDLHDDYTDEIEALIKNSQEWQDFLAWWREPWENKHD